MMTEGEPRSTRLASEGIQVEQKIHGGKKRKHTSNKGNNHKGKGGKSWQDQQEDYYQRLLHSAQKELRKQSKLIRNLELQKLVRKIKEKKESGGSGGDAETTFRQLKELDLELVVQESLRRLGILHLDPKLANANEVAETSGSSSDEDEDAPAENPEPKETKSIRQLSQQEKEMVEKILKHKKLQLALEEWNDKVTEYRRWCLRWQERQELDFATTPTDPAAKKRKISAKQQSVLNSAEQVKKSVFLRLGGDDDSEGEEVVLPYGPGSLAATEERKKNRMGQRQRKAKQTAIRAKSAGRVHRATESINWRKKKSQQATGDGEPSYHTGWQKDAPSKSNGKAGKESNSSSTEQLHPSWAAAKKDKPTIVPFLGKKITF